mgnify:CR=1 FL=1
MSVSTATFGAGCFWCLEAAMNQLDGVIQAVSGYMGGDAERANYQAVCSGNTGHAEVVQVSFDSSVISFSQLCLIFFSLHDPTQLNRQGNDIGTQYRSAIFYLDEKQKQISSELKAEINAKNAFSSAIVTEITPFSNFYPAENYHQDYYNLNGMQPYCQFVVKPKVDKLKKFFAERLKK